jgi:UDP-arabinose 4-epimerase
MGCVLVTGGAGFIGSHTCKQLARAGFYPVVYDNLSTGHSGAVRWGPLVIGDILDAERLDRTLREYRPQSVIHLAASAYVGESVRDPAKYYSNNVAGSLSVADSCRRNGISQIVFSSSCATYGVPPNLPITEKTPQVPISPYGRSKLMVEQILRDFGEAYGLRYASLRYFNAGGADPEGELAERHTPETHLIPCALLAASGGLPHLSIFGDDYGTRDGTCERDYIHVSDLARAHVLACDYLDNEGASIALNLGSGQPASIYEIVSSIERITGRSVPVIVESRRPGDPPVLYASTELARWRLGFAPRLSDIDTIVRTAAPSFGLSLPA